MLEGAKEGEQRGIVLPPLLTRLAFLERAVRKGLCFTLQINFGIDVGGVDGHVPEPGTNGVDVNACAQQMGGGCVSNRVRADALAQQRRARNTGLLRITTQQPMDTVASDSLASRFMNTG